MFTEYFPSILYPIGNNESVVVPDLVRAIRLDPQLRTNPLFFTTYQAKDDEYPEVISHRVYGTTAYHWVIMLMNDRFDPYNDFPKSDKNIRKYCTENYVDMNAIHHYEDVTGHWVDSFTILKNPITNYQFEVSRNEKLRELRILKKELLSEFVQQYKREITQ